MTELSFGFDLPSNAPFLTVIGEAWDFTKGDLKYNVISRDQ